MDMHDCIEVTIAAFCYGNSEYVMEAVQSVLNGSEKIVEVILTDDGSPDAIHRENLKVFSREIKNPTRLHLHPDNAGLPRRMNEMLEVASGKYILSVADDYYEPHSLEKFKSQLDSNKDADAVFAIAQWYDESCTHPMARFFGHLGKEGVYPRKMNGEWLNKRLMRGNWISAPAAMWRKSSLIACGGFDERFSFEDFPIMLKVSSRPGSNFIFLGDVLVRYRRLTERSIHTSPAKKVWSDSLWKDHFTCRLELGQGHIKDLELRRFIYREIWSFLRGVNAHQMNLLLGEQCLKLWFPRSRTFFRSKSRLGFYLGLVLCNIEAKYL